MASRKKKPLSLSAKKSTLEPIEDALDFVAKGKSDALQTSAHKKAGRPKLDEDIAAKSIALRTEDIGHLELLSAQWALKSKSGARLGLTPLVRSIVAVLRPSLEKLESVPESEEDLRAFIESELLK
jgi:hypothetical protein